MRRIYGTGDFEHVNYRYLDEPGKRILAVDAVEKSWGPDSLRFGLGLSSDFAGDALYNLLVSYRKRWINPLGAEWRTDLQIGSTTSLGSEFYQPLTCRRRILCCTERASSNDAPRRSIRATNAWQPSTVKKAQASLDLGVNLYEYGTIRLGVLAGKVKREVDTGTLPFPVNSDTITLGAYNARMILDQLDSVHFPREGWKADFSYLKSDTGLGADDSYKKWDVSGSFVRSFGEHTINLFAAAGDLSGSKLSPAYDQFSWGGFLQLSGLCDRSIDRGKPEVWPRHVLPPTDAQFHFRGRLRRYFAGNRQGRQSVDSRATGMTGSAPRASSSPPIRRSDRPIWATDRRRTGPTASISTWVGRFDVRAPSPLHGDGPDFRNTPAVCHARFPRRGLHAASRAKLPATDSPRSRVVRDPLNKVVTPAKAGVQVSDGTGSRLSPGRRPN